MTERFSMLFKFEIYRYDGGVVAYVLGDIQLTKLKLP